MNKIVRYTKDNTMQYILEKIPEYQMHWKDYIKYWEGDSRTVGLDVADFLCFTIDQIKDKNTAILLRIFRVVEELNVYGDEDVKYAAEMMFLESLTNYNDVEMCSIYVPLLGPESRKTCIELDEQWGTRTPILWPQEVVDEHIRQIKAQTPNYPDGQRTNCPVCDHLSFYKYEFPGSNYICNSCGWVDDKEQYHNPELIGANEVSLKEAKTNYAKNGKIS